MPARFVASLSADQRGATVIEYALIASLIAVAAIGGFVTLGNQMGSTFNELDEAISEAIT